MRILIIDNFDSFTHNLKYYVSKFCSNVDVKRNNEISLLEINNYDSIIISPGPGLPKDSGITIDAIKTFSSTKKILGVCLGNQAIGEVFGAELINLKQPLHGIQKTVEITDSNDLLFKNLPKKILTGRYHSWVIEKNSVVNTPIKVIAIDNDNQIQAIKHENFNVRGVQFHPESILTPEGLQIIKNWITLL